MKTLISKHPELASEHIATLERMGDQASKAVKYFNGIELLESITTREMVLAFLANSIKYLNERILKDIPKPPKVISYRIAEKTFASWLRRLEDAELDEEHFDKIELLFAGYNEIVEGISAFQLRDLDDLEFDKDTLLIEFDERSREKVEKSFYEYARNSQEADLVITTRRISKDLNKLIEIFELSSCNFSVVCREFPFLKTRSKGSLIEFYEDIEAIRNYIAIIDNG